MPKIEITRTELVWPGKYDDEGNLFPPRRVNLPFQVIGRVNETRATREEREEKLAGHVATLSDYWRAEEEQKADPGDGWRNKLIWGNNLAGTASNDQSTSISYITHHVLRSTHHASAITHPVSSVKH